MPSTSPSKPSARARPNASQAGPANAQPSRGGATRGPAKPYRRVLLKLSGESLGSGSTPLDQAQMAVIAQQVKEAYDTGAQIAIVVGGGNIVRGAELAKIGSFHQATADYMGMLGTIINGMALKEALKAAGLDTRVMSAIDVRAVAEPFIRGRALRHLEKGRVLILVAGTGNPFCTTDTCAALRALELDCQVILKATKVDGVYSADPRKDPSARRFERLTFMEAITKNLAVMDMTAFTMCQERGLPIVVFDFRAPGSIRRVIQGEPIGTLITANNEGGAR